MTTTLHLQHATLRCDLAPELGGSIAGLWLDDIPVLRSAPGQALRQARLAGSYPLVPFSNRIGQATFSWAGQHHSLLPNNPPEPHAIHGVGWQHTWTVLQAEAQRAHPAAALAAVSSCRGPSLCLSFGFGPGALAGAASAGAGAGSGAGAGAGSGAGSYIGAVEPLLSVHLQQPWLSMVRGQLLQQQE